MKHDATNTVRHWGLFFTPLLKPHSMRRLPSKSWCWILITSSIVWMYREWNREIHSHQYIWLLWQKVLSRGHNALLIEKRCKSFMLSRRAPKCNIISCSCFCCWCYKSSHMLLRLFKNVDNCMSDCIRDGCNDMFGHR